VVMINYYDDEEEDEKDDDDDEDYDIDNYDEKFADVVRMI